MKIKLNKNALFAIQNEDVVEGVGSSDGFYYDLTKGGYFKPEDVMEDPDQIAEMKKAIELVEELEELYDKVVTIF